MSWPATGVQQAAPDLTQAGGQVPGDPRTDSPRRRGNTRARLLAAALEVFTERSPGAVSVEELVSAAGFTRGAFYSNFSSMDEVFYALFEQQSQLMLDTLRAALPPTRGPKLELEVLNTVLDALRPHGRAWFILQSELQLAALRDPAARAAFLRFREQFHSQLATVIAGALAEMRRDPEPDLATVTDAVAAIYLASLANEHLTDAAGTPAGLVPEVLPRLVLSLSSPHQD